MSGQLDAKLSGSSSHTGFRFTPTIHRDTYPAVDPCGQGTDMRGRYILITGASRGLGRAIAQGYARAGASGIALAARSDTSGVAREVRAAAAEAGREPPRVLTVVMDVIDPTSVREGFDRVATGFAQRLDVLICNAGYMEEWRPLGETDVEDWWRSWEVNIKGNMLVWRAALPLLLRHESGLKTIVNLSSIGAHLCTPNGSAYQTTKLALIRLSGCLNVEYGNRGLLAYSVHPGGIVTELADKLPEEIRRKLTDTPELAANTMVYLTKERREWLRGRYVSCTWDMPEFTAMKEVICEKDLLKVKMSV